MAFVYAYSLTDEDWSVKDFVADAAYSGKRGDLVTLNAAGNVVAPAANPATVLGVYEGGSFQGITQGSPYAATTVTNNSQSTKLAKVRVASADSVFRIPLKAGAAAPAVGTKYGIDNTVDAHLDTANTTTGAIYQVVEYDADAKNAFVTITGRVVA